MMKILFAKKTERKLVWKTKIDDTPFSLYIPKWRVPEPIPLAIRVSLEVRDAKIITPHFSKMEIQQYPELKVSPIICLVEYKEHHTKTLQYKPTGNEPEIGEPYIPYSLTYNDSRYLLIKVMWGVNGTIA